MATYRKLDLRRVCLCAGGLRTHAAAYYFSIDTSVALIIAKTLSPTLRFIRLTEPVVIIDVTSPAAVRIVSSETTLSETILSIVPGSRFRMLALMGSNYRNCDVFQEKTSRFFKLASVLVGLGNRPCARASRSRCQLHRKREPRRDVTGCTKSSLTSLSKADGVGAACQP